MAPFMRPHLKNHPLNTNSPVYYTNSTFIVSTIVSKQLMQIVFTSFLFGHYKRLPSMNNIFMYTSFFSNSNSTFISIAHFFVGLQDLGRFSLFVHLFICPITCSFLDGFQPNLVQHFPHVCSTCHTVFSLNNTLKFTCEGLLHLFAITWTPDKSFA